MLRPFALHRPGTPEEACALLARFGDDAIPYAGGTELLLVMKMGLAHPQHLVDVKRLPGFDAIEMRGDRLVIGAAVTHRSLERSILVRERCPLLASVARHIANVRVRNAGTVGGNLAFADPHSDLATLLLTLDARVELVSPRGRRAVTLGEFVRSPYETAREPDELLAAVSLVPWPSGTAATYVKFGVHERPTLGIALALSVDRGAPGRGQHVADARLAIGCVNPVPVRVTAAEARLAAVGLSDLETVSADVSALAAQSADAVDDLHGTAEYKRELVAVFTRRALAAVTSRARGIEPGARYQYTVVV